MKLRKPAKIAATVALFLLLLAAGLTQASAWIGLHDEGDVRISGSIGEVEPEVLVEPPGLQLGSSGYDCEDGAFRVAAQNNGVDPVAVMLELWRASDDGTPTDRLDGTTYELTAGGAKRLSIDAKNPDGIYRLKVFTEPDGADAQWSAPIAVEGNCDVEVTPVPTDEPTEEPTDEATDEPTEEPTDEPTDEPTVEVTLVTTEEPTGEPTDEPTDEPTVTDTPDPDSGDESESSETPTPEETPEPEDTPTPAPPQDEVGGTSGESGDGE